jgi:branched-chain amino acid transport system substrate-binding protein
VTVRRRALPALAAALLVVSVGACSTREPEQVPSGPSGEPIVIGSTLALTGAFAATGVIHKIAGETFVDRLNDAGGLLGRPVVWRVLDDASTTANIVPLYEQLLSGPDAVDLIIGPYATPNILAAMGVAERFDKVMPHHTAVLRPALTYECQFPGWSIGPEPNAFIPDQLFDLLETLPEPPETVAVATVQNGSAAFVTNGFQGDPRGVPVIAEERGLDVVVNQPYPIGTTDWTGIAQAVANAQPDVFISNSLGVDTVGQLNAMAQLGYRPPLTFSLFPAPGPLLGLGEAGEGVLAWSLFEANAPAIERLGGDVQAIVDDYTARADAQNVPYTAFETQAAASWNAWEILVSGVEAAGSTEDQAICDALHSTGADTTFSGHLTFDPAVNNFWDTTVGIKQIQDGEWVMVWPADQASGELRGPSS